MLFHIRSNNPRTDPCSYQCRSLATQHLNSRSRFHIITEYHRITGMKMIVGTDIIPDSLFILPAPVVFLFRIPHRLAYIIIIQQVLHNIINLSGVYHQVNKARSLMIIHIITAQKIKRKTIRHNTFRAHGATLVIVIETLIQRIIFSHILIQTDTQQRIYQNDRLVERRDLRVDKRNLRIGNLLLQLPEPLSKPLLYCIQIGKLSFHIIHQTNQRRI